MFNLWLPGSGSWNIRVSRSWSGSNADPMTPQTVSFRRSTRSVLRSRYAGPWQYSSLSWTEDRKFSSTGRITPDFQVLRMR